MPMFLQMLPIWLEWQKQGGMGRERWNWASFTIKQEESTADFGIQLQGKLSII